MGPFRGKKPLGTKPPARKRQRPTKLESHLQRRVGGWQAALDNKVHPADPQAFHKPGSKRAKGK